MTYIYQITHEMTEDQIERRVERLIDILDRAFMRGDIDQQAYDKEISIIDKWAQAQYDARR